MTVGGERHGWAIRIDIRSTMLCAYGAFYTSMLIFGTDCISNWKIGRFDYPRCWKDYKQIQRKNLDFIRLIMLLALYQIALLFVARMQKYRIVSYKYILIELFWDYILLSYNTKIVWLYRIFLLWYFHLEGMSSVISTSRYNFPILLLNDWKNKRKEIYVFI